MINNSEKKNRISVLKNLGKAVCSLVLFLFTGILLSGCSSENRYLNKAADLYAEGKYDEAETAFLKAIRNGEKSVTVFSGYAFNQLKMGDDEGAKALFELMMNQNNTYGDYFDKEPATGEAVRKGLLGIYMKENNYEDAIVLLKELGDTVTDPGKKAEYKAEAALLAWRSDSESYFGDNKASETDGSNEPLYSTDELIALITDAIDAGNQNIKMYRMRGDLYWIKGEWDLWESDERKIIELKDYAVDEYNAILGMRISEKGVAEVLSLVDEAIVYLNGHSAYIDDYTDIIPMILTAADYSTRIEWKNDSQYYFDLAEAYIKAAEDKEVSDNEILKYKIIVAERKGKMELAYKLLGVYLEHCPEDRMAYKEQKYLENRLGVSGE